MGSAASVTLAMLPTLHRRLGRRLRVLLPLSLAVPFPLAFPVGGMGIARQAKDEIFQCPPIVVLTGRVADNWLANWSRAEAAVAHPLDPIVLAGTVADLLRRRRAELTTS